LLGNGFFKDKIYKNQKGRNVVEGIKIVLASASPRRRELLKQIKMDFEVISSKKEEIITSKLPEKIVEELANQKALDVFDNLNEDNFMVIGADTVVAKDGKVLGKPKTKKEAYEMISSLKDSSHSVYTGVSMIVKIKNSIPNELLEKYNNRKDIVFFDQGDEYTIELTFFEKTDVFVRDMTESQIEEYINSDEPYDKAGGYGIQGYFAKYISKIEGDYYNVVGLPIARLSKEYESLLENIKL